MRDVRVCRAGLRRRRISDHGIKEIEYKTILKAPLSLSANIRLIWLMSEKFNGGRSA
ncbi:MAG: hypothetical protein ACI9YG_002023, partial [Candidatus Azotimanducaceae bacterium]